MVRSLEALVLAALLNAAGVVAAFGAEPVALACSADRPTVAIGETVLLKAWAATPPGQTLRYAWEATAGRLEAEGPEARWTLSNLRPGRYAASVRVEGPAGQTAECLLRVIVRQDPAARLLQESRPLARETGSALLLESQGEAAEYGLYSYLLLGSPPAGAVRERYLGVIEAVWRLVPEIARLEAHVPRQELNIAYVPVTSPPPGAVSAEWILEKYDYARARTILRLLPGTHRDGPYVVSALRPLAAPTPLGPVLFQDLSRVPPHLVSAWVKEFLNQAAQERFWEERTGQQLAHRLRLTIGVLAAGLPEVRRALDDWIAWVR